MPSEEEEILKRLGPKDAAYGLAQITAGHIVMFKLEGYSKPSPELWRMRDGVIEYGIGFTLGAVSHWQLWSSDSGRLTGAEAWLVLMRAPPVVVDVLIMEPADGH